MSTAFRLEEKGKDYVVIPNHQSKYCPTCFSKPEGFHVEFIVEDGSEIDLEAWAERRKRIPILIICYNNHVVCRTMAEVFHWKAYSHSFEEESSDIGEIRKILNLMKQGGLAVPYPSTELLEETFIPGKLTSLDIWVSDRAYIEESAILKRPLLIGTGVRVEKNAVCGPHAIVVNDSVVRKDYDVSYCIFSENQRIFNAGDDAILSMLGPNVKGLPFKEAFPIHVSLVDDPQLPYRFNYGTLYVISINKSIPAIETLKEELVSLLAKEKCLEEVVFESFSSDSPSDTLVVEVGNKIPMAIIKCVVKSCLQTVAFPINFALLTENGKFGYTQRAYFGSISPSPGVSLSRDKAMAILEAGSIYELRRINR
jgi:hypothetical protein